MLMLALMETDISTRATLIPDAFSSLPVLWHSPICVQVNRNFSWPGTTAQWLPHPHMNLIIFWDIRVGACYVEVLWSALVSADDKSQGGKMHEVLEFPKVFSSMRFRRITLARRFDYPTNHIVLHEYLQYYAKLLETHDLILSTGT